MTALSITDSDEVEQEQMPASGGSSPRLAILPSPQCAPKPGLRERRRTAAYDPIMPVSMTADDLINCKQLAARMGRNAGYVSAMKGAGYDLPYPGRTTLSHALNWLGDHPDFRTTSVYPGWRKKARKRAAGSLKPQQRREHLLA